MITKAHMHYKQFHITFTHCFYWYKLLKYSRNVYKFFSTKKDQHLNSIIYSKFYNTTNKSGPSYVLKKGIYHYIKSTKH